MPDAKQPGSPGPIQEQPRATPAARRHARSRRPHYRGALERVSNARFPVGLRGYERQAVDRYVAEVSQLVAELEATQLPESVIQRALDEVGEQTSGILHQAREAADEITARSRAQAEGRIQRAEQEAEVIRREAEQHAEAVLRDASRVWEERRRLIEDLRRLAEEVLTVADDALERLEEPSPAIGPGAGREETVEPATGEADAVEPETVGPETVEGEQAESGDVAVADQPTAVVQEGEPPGGGQPEDPSPRT